MKIQILTLSLGLLFIQPAVAVTSKPEKCPSVAALATVGVDATGQGTHIWMAFPNSPSYYDTKQMWSFGIYVTASSREEAIEKGRASIRLLSESNGPYHDDDDRNDLWTCEYGGGNPHVDAYAFTLPLRSMKMALRK